MTEVRVWGESDHVLITQRSPLAPQLSVKQNTSANVTSNRKERQVQKGVIYQHLFNLLEMKDLEFVEGMHITCHVLEL